MRLGKNETWVGKLRGVGIVLPIQSLVRVGVVEVARRPEPRDLGVSSLMGETRGWCELASCVAEPLGRGAVVDGVRACEFLICESASEASDRRRAEGRSCRRSRRKFFGFGSLEHEKSPRGFPRGLLIASVSRVI